MNLRLLLIAAAFAASGWSDPGQKLFELYQQGQYLQGCEYGFERFGEQRSNEPFISLLGFTCLKADKIDKLSPIITLLGDSAEARSNAAYFSLLVMQKKLLMQALYDNKPIANLRFPMSSHTLSKVFDLYVKNPQTAAIVKEYTDPSDGRLSYRLYITQSNGHKTVAVDEYYDKILTVHHVY